MTLTAKRVSSKAKEDTDIWFESVFKEHWQRVYGVLYRLLGDPDEAQDLALEAFWRLHQRLPKNGEKHNLDGWLYRVATNLGLNALRSRQRRQRYESDAGHRVLEEDPPLDPAIEIERQQDREQVRATLAQMKPRSARLLILRHSGLTYAEMAAALGLAPSSVGTLLARAEREFEERYLNTA
ncbi:MAG: sigma-70 family RNA polymerase sigma factor [Anaerolineales bacterium]|nr:sigma-70 family RNA polymerase sigma factor [Anaerolineales bacterium]